jgi:hypothetical protein
LIGTQENSVVAIYESHTGAEAALKEIRKAGMASIKMKHQHPYLD